MNRKEIAKKYCDGHINLVSILTKLPYGIISKFKANKYHKKLSRIVGWKHAHGISVPDTSLYDSWRHLKKFIGRKQDYTAIIGWGYRTAIWVEEFNGHKYVILNSTRGTSFECDSETPYKDVYGIIDHLEDVLLPNN